MEKNVNPDQQIRAAAAQATAVLMSSVPPPPGDFIAMTEVVEMYIRDGKGAAFALCPDMPEVQQESAPAVVEPQPAVRELPPAAVATPVALLPPSVPQREGSEEGRDADVIPLAARGTVSPKQEGARRIIEKHRKERVDSLIAQAGVAKAKAHKERLLNEAEENDLLDYAIVIDNKTTTVGAYLGSLLGS